ncbi:MAG TPA: hypothetical protein VEQ84_04510 [Vicinamibacteria bacterium]|nr:hypothetical protein [Vicinamibacteria bacterium]
MRIRWAIPAFAAVAALGGAAGARAIEPPEPDFGLVGIARGETARLSLVLCDGSVRPGDGRVRRCDGSVVPGVATSLDLPASEALGGGRLRRSLRPVVRVLTEPPDPEAPSPCAGLVPTLEVFDAFTGRTSFVYAPPPRFIEPPDPEHR